MTWGFTLAFNPINVAMQQAENLMTVIAPSSRAPATVAGGAPKTGHPSTRRTDRPLAALLLAAAVAALAVAAERLMASWADEHLLATWVALWAVVFAGSLLLAGTARRTAQRVIGRLDQWARERAQSRAEARMRLLARHDPRVMADLQAARDRADTSAHTEASIPLGRPERVVAPAGVMSQEWNGHEGVVIEMGGSRRMVPFYI